MAKECQRSFSDKVRKFTYADKERFLNVTVSGEQCPNSRGGSEADEVYLEKRILY